MATPQTDDSLLVGRLFVGALERQAWGDLAPLFDPGVKFRALIPSWLRAADDREAAAGYLQKWFGDADQLLVLSSEAKWMHDRLHIRYLIREHEDQWYIVEQQAYCTVQDGCIKEMNLLCSGFRPEAAQESS